MNVRTFPGGTYVDALPSGEFAYLVPGSHLQTHAGRVDLPPGNEPLFHRITTVGGFKIAGQAQHGNVTLEFREGQWVEHPRACGVSPVIYDRAGVLHISNCGPVGSQGFRFVDDNGRIWTGDETYRDPVGLYEWSAVADLKIGQGQEGGVCVYDGHGVLRLLDDGHCTFVRVQGVAERVAISYVKRGVGSVVVTATLAELAALPPVVTTSTQPTQPAPIPSPTPEPIPMSVPDYSAEIAAYLGPRLRRIEGDEEGTRALSFSVLNECLAGLHQRDPRVGLLEKTGGAQVRNRAADIMLYDLGNGTAQVVDVIADGEGHDGTPRPSWGLADIRPISQWRAPYPVAAQPVPTPQPTPVPSQPAPVDLAPILARIDAQAAVIADTNAALLRLAEVIEKMRIPAPAPVQFPDYSGRLPYLGSITLKPVK